MTNYVCSDETEDGITEYLLCRWLMLGNLRGRVHGHPEFLVRKLVWLKGILRGFSVDSSGN